MLIRCPSCDTHVRADDSVCPFCGEAGAPRRGPSLMAKLGIGAGVTLAALLSISACAYGCPDGDCSFPVFDAGVPDAGAGLDAAPPDAAPTDAN